MNKTYVSIRILLFTFLFFSITRSQTIRYQQTVRGGLATVANGLVRADSTGSANGTPLNVLGGDSMSTSADLILPPGSKIVKAILYVEGYTLIPNQHIDSIRFKVPGSSYKQFTNASPGFIGNPQVTKVDTADLGGIPGYFTGAYAQFIVDVTNYMPANGYVTKEIPGGDPSQLGQYAVADVRPYSPHNKGYGWSIFVVYTNPISKVRNVTIADTCDLYDSDHSINYRIRHVTVPTTGTVNAVLAATASWGDIAGSDAALGLGSPFGDYLSIGKADSDLTNLFDPTTVQDTDICNGTIGVCSKYNVIADDGAVGVSGDMTARNPNFGGFYNLLSPNGTTSGPAPWYGYYYDCDVMDATGDLPNSTSPIDIGLYRYEQTPNSDRIGAGAYGLSVDLVAAELTKSISPSSISSGGTATYTWIIDNTTTGSDITGISFTDSLPHGIIIANPSGATIIGGSGGILQADPGTRQVDLSNFDIPANTSATITVVVTNFNGKLNPSCGSAPEFTNGSKNIINTSANLSNKVTDQCLVVTSSCPLDAGPFQAICLHDAVQLSATQDTNYTYQWSPATGLDNPNIYNPVATPSVTTKYTVSIINNKGNCSASDSVSVFIKGPFYSLTKSVSTCPGTPVQIGPLSSPTYTYQWSPSAGLDDPSLRNPTATVGVATDYAVNINDPGTGCSVSDTVHVLINALPGAAISPVDGTFHCASDVFQFSVASDPNSSYQWSPSGAFVNNTVYNPTFKAPYLPLNDTVVTFKVIVKNKTTGCIATDSVTQNFYALPLAKAGPDQALCKVGTVTIGSPQSTGLSYSWGPVTGLSSPNQITTSASPTVTTVYTLTVTDAHGCMNFSSVKVNIRQGAIANAGGDTGTCTSHSVTLSTPFNPLYSYHWYGPSVKDLSDSLIHNPVASPSVTTTYYLKVNYTDIDCPSYDTIQVSVKELPIAYTTGPQRVCGGEKVALGMPTNPAYTYKWSPATFLDNPNIASPLASPTVDVTYTVSVSYKVSTPGCVHIVSTPVGVFNPVGAAGRDTTICKGSGIVIGSKNVPTYLYHWSPSQGLSDSTVSAPVASPTAPATYTVSVYDTELHCQIHSQIAIGIFEVPTAFAGTPPVSPLCAGSPYAIGSPAIPGQSYSWDKTLVTNYTSSNPTVNPTTTTTYTVTVSNGNCKAYSSVVIPVIPLPSVPVNSSGTICNEGSYVLGDGSLAAPHTSYAWSPSLFVNDTTVVNPVFSPTVTSASTYTYHLSIYDSLTTCSNTRSVTVQIKASPTVSYSGTAICQGSPTVIGQGLPATLSYTWIPGTDLNKNNVASPTATLTATTTYTLSFTDVNHCSALQPVVITVRPYPVYLLSKGATICYGDGLELGDASNSPLNQYKWRPGKSLDDSSSFNPIGNPLVSTTYLVTVTEATGLCATTGSVIVGVQKILVNSHSYAMCKDAPPVTIGDPLQLNCQYSWSPGYGLSSTTGAQPVASPPVTTIYTVSVFNTVTFCRSVATDTVKVLEVLAGAGTDKEICNGQGVALGRNDFGYTYSWSPAFGLSATTGSSPIAQPTQNATYFVTITDQGMCGITDVVLVNVHPLPTALFIPPAASCQGDSVELGAPTNKLSYHYHWSPSTGLGSDSEGDVRAAPDVSTSYLITVTDNSPAVCTSTYTTQVNVVLSGFSIPEGPYRLCQGASVTLNPGGISTVGYNWAGSGLDFSYVASPVASPTVTTYYHVSVTSGNCLYKDSVLVQVSKYPLAVTLPARDTSCVGGPLLLHPLIDHADTSIHCLWSLYPGYNPVLATGSAIDVYPLVATTYYLQVSNGFCVVNLADQVAVQPLSISVTSADVCRGGAAFLQASVLQGHPVSYAWQTPQGTVTENQGHIIVTPEHTSDYTVSATDSRACLATALAHVNVTSLSGTQIVAPVMMEAGDKAQLSLAGLPPGSFALHWSGPALSSDSALSPYIQPQSNATYILVITQALAPFCQVSDTAVVRVEKKGCSPDDIKIPSAFSPNGDGKNDVLYVRGPKLSEIDCIIFNRWGEEITELKSINQGWDGTYHGQQLDPQVFVFYITAKCTGIDDTIELKGNITLLR